MLGRCFTSSLRGQCLSRMAVTGALHRSLNNEMRNVQSLRWLSSTAIPTPSTGSRTTIVEHPNPTSFKRHAESQQENGKTPTKFAVISLAGTQFKVASGDRIIVNKLDAEVGKELLIDEVLLIGTRDKTFVGRPKIENAAVKAFVEEQTKDAKLIILKKRRRNHRSRRLKGHRRKVTFLYIEDILFDEDNTIPEGQ